MQNQSKNEVRLKSIGLREYQKPLWDAFMNKDYRNIIAVWPRRAGKDYVCYNMLFRAALLNKPAGVYFLVYPTYAQGKKILWDSMSSDGKRFIDMIPKEFVAQVNSQEMKIRLVNGSLLQVIGSDNIDSIVGTNPICILYSEMALQDERAYQMLRPILAANGGKCVMISTPRGKNFFHQIFTMAKESKNWFVSYLTLDDTQHIPLSEIERDRQEGLLSEALIRQEFWCDWNMGIQGSYYGKILDKMRLRGQIGKVLYDPSHLTHCAVDIGWNDPTSVIFFQVINNAINIIDYHESDHEKLEFYADLIKNRGYRMGKYIGPHDLRKHSLETGNTRWMVLNQLGLLFDIAPDIGRLEGITKAQSVLERCCIDDVKCARLIKCLENYRAQYNPKNDAYSEEPMHTWASHGADAFRYLAVSLDLLQNIESTPQQLEERFRKAVGFNEPFKPIYPNYNGR